MPTIRLLACDLDGTLIGDDYTISPRVREALQAAQAQGVHVTLATGRSFPSTLPFAQTLQIRTPLICYQGGLIQHPLSGEVLYQATMDRAIAEEAIALAHERGWHLVLYVGEEIYLEGLRRPLDFYHNLLGTRLRLVEDLRTALTQDPVKFLFVAEEPQADEIERVLRRRFDRRIVIVRSHRLFVEGNPPGVSKGAALAHLAALLKVPQEAVMAIGDQGNDVTMLRWAGVGVAMGNASPEARAAADWIAPPLEADGVAVAVERFVLRDP
ncbi:MAG: HAD family phosphatase [Chloroflexi bacterium]|nr:MAG: HAD family phosphatase [Chloroflexota bacterium]